MRRAADWLAALCVDTAFGEPPTVLHPVAWIGRVIGLLERHAPVGRRARLGYGVLLVAIPSAAAAGVGITVDRIPWRLVRVPVRIWLLKTTFALRALGDAGRRVETALAEDDPVAARAELRALVSRSVEDLDGMHLASAAVESLGENLVDSYLAPMAAHAFGGLPGALAYRAVNTADAMVGYRGRYEELGKASARLDDMVNLLPARIAAAALAVAAPAVGGSVHTTLGTAIRQHGRTASPNAGWAMAATAGALGVWLEKVDHYRLGTDRAPVPSDIDRARRLVVIAALAATAAAPLPGLASRLTRRPRPGRS